MSSTNTDGWFMWFIYLLLIITIIAFTGWVLNLQTRVGELEQKVEQLSR